MKPEEKILPFGRYLKPSGGAALSPAARFAVTIAIMSNLCVFIARGGALVAPDSSKKLLLILLASLTLAGFMKWLTRGESKGVLTTSFASITALAVVTGNHGPLNFYALMAAMFVCWFAIIVIANCGVDEKVDRLPASTIFWLAGIALVSVVLTIPKDTKVLVLVLGLLAVVGNVALVMCLCHAYANYVLAKPGMSYQKREAARELWRKNWRGAIVMAIVVVLVAALLLYMLCLQVKQLESSTKTDPVQADEDFRSLFAMGAAFVTTAVLTLAYSARRLWRMLSVWLLYEGEKSVGMYQPFVQSVNVRRSIFGGAVFLSILPYRASYAIYDVVIVAKFGTLSQQFLNGPSDSLLVIAIIYAISFLAPLLLLPAVTTLMWGELGTLEREIENAEPDEDAAFPGWGEL